MLVGYNQGEMAKNLRQGAKTPKLADRPEHRRSSGDVIYEAMMRGGASFGAPFRHGVASLTEHVVRHFKQRGFFGFETLERPGDNDNTPQARRNKFTRYGAARFFGPYRKPPH